MEAFITSRGGIFIEEFRKDGRNYVKFICDNNHNCIKRTDSFGNNGWCRECNKTNIDDAYTLAYKYGFKFLSEKYVNTATSYLWECLFGHQWNARYYNIYSGKGCPECLKVPYEFFVDLITNKGGKIITQKNNYVDLTTRIKFICEENHECETTGATLRQKHWCLECNMSINERTCRKIFEYLFKKQFMKSRHLKNPETNNSIELDGYNKELKIAFEYNGIQHYKLIEYWQDQEKFDHLQNTDKLKIQLCKENDINLIVIPYTVKYEDLYTFIINQFPNNNFEKTIDYSILNVGSANKDRLDEIQNFVKQYGITLFSTQYIDNTTSLDFMCGVGHAFSNTWATIQQGTLCVECNKIKKKENIVATKIADYCEKYNFKLISQYTLAKDTSTIWECNLCKEQFTRSWDSMRGSKKSHTRCPAIKKEKKKRKRKKKTKN
jgi:hypothetical protein